MRKLIPSIAVLAFLASACAAPGAAGPSLAAGERTIYMAAVEPKGSASSEREVFPEASLPAGGGYVLTDPDDEGTWGVSTYRWEPSQIVLVEGDQVTLEILGINGASHPTVIEGHDVEFEVLRGQLSTVEFTAGPPGVYRMTCSVHAPSMVADLVVLPQS